MNDIRETIMLIQPTLLPPAPTHSFIPKIPGPFTLLSQKLDNVLNKLKRIEDKKEVAEQETEEMQNLP